MSDGGLYRVTTQSGRLFDNAECSGMHGGKKSAHVVIDNVAGWALSVQDTFNPLKDLGPVRMPFPDMWMEWTVSASRTMGDDVRRPRRIGARLTEISDDMLSIVLYVPIGKPGRTFMMPANELLVTTDGSGMFEESEFVHEGSHDNARLNGSLRKSMGDGVVDNAITDPMKNSHYYGPLAAIGLMNCRNVRVESHDSGISRSSSPKKRRVQTSRLVFRTIVIPGSAQGSRSDIVTALGNKLPFHVVRGNFATYTADAPLFGSLLGTFWRPAHVRGSKSVGIVESTYEVRTQDSELK